MAKPRHCPHCSQAIPFDTGFRFDEYLNMLCNNCNKVVVPVETEFEEKPPVKIPVAPYYGTGIGHGGYPGEYGCD